MTDEQKTTNTEAELTHVERCMAAHPSGPLLALFETAQRITSGIGHLLACNDNTGMFTHISKHVADDADDLKKMLLVVTTLYALEVSGKHPELVDEIRNHDQADGEIDFRDWMVRASSAMLAEIDQRRADASGTVVLAEIELTGQEARDFVQAMADMGDDMPDLDQAEKGLHFAIKTSKEAAETLDMTTPVKSFFSKMAPEYAWRDDLPESQNILNALRSAKETQGEGFVSGDEATELLDKLGIAI